jgi:universal stress protein A
VSIYRRILLVVDLGEHSERIGARARDLASVLGAELSVLHVVEYVPVEPMGETLLPAVQIEEELVQRARVQSSASGSAWARRAATSRPATSRPKSSAPRRKGRRT